MKETIAATGKASVDVVITDNDDGDNDNDNDNNVNANDGGVVKKEKKVKKKEKKQPPPNLVIPPKRAKLSKAERRALQEQQRAAKAGGGGGKGHLQPTPKKHVQEEQQTQQSSGGNDNNNNNESNNGDTTTTTNNNAGIRTGSNQTSGSGNGCLDLFSHLPQYREMPDPYASEFTETLHTDVIELGLKFASGEIQGDNERCRAMMETFLQVLDDYNLPPPSSSSTKSTTKAPSSSSSNNINTTISTNTNIDLNNNNINDFRHHFDHQVLKPSFQFWTVHCRPHSVSMGNAFTFLKTAVGSLDRDIHLVDAKRELKETITRYLQERLEYADRAIAQHALSKIHDGDVLLTFGHSEAIEVLLKTAHTEAQIQFYVWIVDSRPLMEGKRKLLKSLRSVGISCGYIQLNALTYVMQQQVTKVFLGASALLVNGSIYGQIGTACVALIAKNHHIPVLVCCETYKISNKVQLESITNNELGNPDDLLLLYDDNKNKDTTTKSKSKSKSKLNVVNLLYDVTPDKFISGIITELGIIPPTSVAVLLREMNMINDRAY